MDKAEEMHELIHKGVQELIASKVNPKWYTEDLVKLKLAMCIEKAGYEVYPEINTERMFKLEGTKKRIDLFITNPDKKEYGIEIAYPLAHNDQTLDGVFKIWVDIDYLVKLRDSRHQAQVDFSGYFLMVTNNDFFWNFPRSKRSPNTRLYNCIRSEGANKIEIIRIVTRKSKAVKATINIKHIYTTTWKPEKPEGADFPEGKFRYFIVEVK